LQYFKEKKKENGDTWFGAIFGGIIDAIKGSREWFWKNIVSPFMKNLIKALLGEDAAKKFDEFSEKILENIKKSWDNLKDVILLIGAAIKNPADVVKNIWSKLKEAWNNITTSLDISVEYKTEGLNTVQKAIIKVLDLDGWPELTIGAKALGGVFKNGTWKNIPQFASGMPSGIRGSLFFAGEAGPEIVAQGRGGSSEILNASQIASAIYSATVAANKSNGGKAVVQIVPDTKNMYRAVVKQNNTNILITNKNLLGGI